MKVRIELSEADFRTLVETLRVEYDLDPPTRRGQLGARLKQIFQRIDQAGAEYIREKWRRREGVVPFPVLVGVVPDRE